jgi:hypothetical protein
VSFTAFTIVVAEGALGVLGALGADWVALLTAFRMVLMMFMPNNAPDRRKQAHGS